MIDTANLIIFLVATITLNLTPGPDMMYVIGRSIGQGTRAGVTSSLGIGAGCLVHTLAAALGLSALLMSSAVAFNVIKYVGAVYLIYLGIRALCIKQAQASVKPLSDGGYMGIFRQGVIINVFNPKVALFFLAFLPQFVDASKGSPTLQMTLLGSIFVVSGTIWNTITALLAGHVGDNLMKRPRLIRLQQWISGSVFITLGVRLAVTGRT